MDEHAWEGVEWKEYEQYGLDNTSGNLVNYVKETISPSWPILCDYSLGLYNPRSFLECFECSECFC